MFILNARWLSSSSAASTHCVCNTAIFSLYLVPKALCLKSLMESRLLLDVLQFFFYRYILLNDYCSSRFFFLITHPNSSSLLCISPKPPVASSTSRPGDFAHASSGSNADARNFRGSGVGLVLKQKVTRIYSLFSPQSCQETR